MGYSDSNYWQTDYIPILVLIGRPGRTAFLQLERRQSARSLAHIEVVCFISVNSGM